MFDLYRPKIDTQIIKSFCHKNTHSILRALQVHGEYGRYYCPLCQPNPSEHKTPDMSVKDAAVCCWRCGWRGDVIKLYMDTRNVGFMKALEDLSGESFTHTVNSSKAKPKKAKPKKYYRSHEEAINSVIYKTNYSIVQYWKYVDEDHSDVMVVYRLFNGEKSYRPISFERGMGWFIGRHKTTPLYNLPSLLSTNSTVFVVEGEKAADALIGIGITATTSAGGANGVNSTDWGPVAYRRVIVWPDNDKSGMVYANSVKQIIPNAEIWQVPDMGPKEDAYDFVQKHKNPLKTLRSLYEHMARQASSAS